MISANQQLLDNAIGHAVDLTQYSNTVVRDILAILNEADKELVAKIQARQIDNWTTKRLNSVLVDVRAVVSQGYNAARGEMTKQMLEFAGNEAGAAARSLLMSQMSSYEWDAMKKYVGTQSSIINKFFRGLNPELTDSQKLTRNELLRLINRSVTTEPLTVYRGLRTEVYKNVKAGDILKEQGFLSASLDKDVAQFSFEGNKGQLIELKLPKGSRAFNVTPFEPAEKEFMLAPGHEFRVDSVDGNVIKATVVMMNPPTNPIFVSLLPTAEQLAAIVSTEPILVGEGQVALLEEIFQGLAANKEKTIRQAVRLGMVEGETIDQMVRRLVGTKAARFTDGIIEKDRRGAEAMVRTIVNSTSNKAAAATYKANGDIIKGLAWTSTLDSRTSPICQARDGKIFPVDSGPRPPAHVNCRSFMVPVLKSWKELGVPLDEMDEGMRASMDGLVPESTTYGTWLKGKDESFQEKVLGVERARLFRSGEYDIKDFVNAKGEYKKLSDL